ncbi:hypothetical protein SAMN05660662_1402 [Blastococcus aurantiacus]|uniref:Uncharacterized protein n=1 Tax=Blastococcus aurantiacus TaxID=1550231 RepID=A0A1G7JB19_9ACTN|nr:hypothetical protein [Blastococcus aurantiacus]SDF22088.1 hypothetical protein SAMN05660662_1402 [Blastococcus aurantiacus]
MTAPGRYELVVPDGWWAIDLSPGRWQKQIAALVDRQWRGIDDAPHLKAQARAELEEQASRAADAGGLQFFLSVGTLAGVPLSASLLVSGVPLADPAELEALARRRRDEGAEVTEVVLPAGPALRAQWRQEAEQEDAPATTCLDLHVPVPQQPRVLLLQFRTPMEPLAAALVEVFDAVATTLRWASTDPADEEPGGAGVVTIPRPLLQEG